MGAAHAPAPPTPLLLPPQAGRHTDVLLLIVLAEKEASGRWGDAVATFEWVMHQGTSALAASRAGEGLPVISLSA